MNLLVKHLPWVEIDHHHLSRSLIVILLTLPLSFGLWACDEDESSPHDEARDTQGAVVETVVDDESTLDDPEPDLAPQWDEMARAWVEGELGEGLVLHWSAASDDHKVIGYRIERDGVLIAEVDGEQRSLTLNPLSNIEDYSFQIIAGDAGNQWTRGPITIYTVNDSSPPTWPIGATMIVSSLSADDLSADDLSADDLSADDLSADGLVITWPHAIDNVDVTRYLFVNNGAEPVVIEGTRYVALMLEPEREYTFQVWAEDAATNRSESLNITITTPAPQGSAPEWSDESVLEVIGTQLTSLDVQWTAATDDTGVHQYIIYRNLAPVLTVSGTELRGRVEGLIPNTDYQLSVAAEDVQGNRVMGPSVDARIVHEVDDEPPSWPDGALHVNVEDAHVIQLSWDEATDDVGVVGYQIWLDNIEIASVDVEVQSYRVEGLSPWTEYDLTVKAFDAAGNISLNSPNVRARTLDTVLPTWHPEDRLEVLDLTSNSLRLIWPSPRDDVGIDQVMVYRDGDLLTTLPRDNNEYIVHGLTPWTSYLFEVRAVDIAGNQTLENLTVSVRTSDDERPSWESGARLRAIDIDETSCVLQWGVANDDVDVIYQVSQDGELLVTVNTDTTEHLVEGLSPWTWYDFQVQALDPAGNHATSNLSLRMRTLDNTTPTWPENAELSYSELGESSLTLHWPTAHDHFAVTYQLYRDGTLDEELSDGETMFVVEDLIPSTDYSFHVVAIDPVGNPSLPLSLHIQTLEQPAWRPELAAQDPNRKLLITFHVPGAWDPSSAFDPKGYTTESAALRINNYHQSEIQQPSYDSPIRWAPGTANHSFFEEFGERLLIINGVDVGSNLTKSATRSVGGGHVVQRYPSIAALHAAINAPQAPLAFISHGGYEETAHQLPLSRLSEQHLWSSIASPNNYGSTVNAYLHEDEFNRANTLVTRRLRRRLEDTRFPPQQAVFKSMLSAAQIGGLEYFTQYDDGGSRNGSLPPRLHTGLVAFKAGLTAALNLEFRYSFSVLEGGYSQTAWKFEILWGALRTIWALVEEQGLEEQVIVMVVCPLGRTALSGPDGNKQRWPITSFLFFGAGVEGNRVIGGTDHRMMPRPIDPETLQVVEGGEVVLTTAHIHAALRELLGISEHPLAKKYPLNVPILPIFD